jgi:hypothetical protein
MRCFTLLRQVHFVRPIVCAFAFAFSLAGSSFGREWTDNTGKFHREGEFMQLDGDAVWLVGPKENSIRVSWKRLSTADQSYIKSELAKLKFPVAKPEFAAPSAQLGQTLFRFASFQPRSLTIEQDDEKNYDTEGAKRWIRKHIYSGCCNTFHLVGAWGTAAYHWHGHHYLAFLIRDFVKEGVDPSFFYYFPWYGSSDITGWALQRWSYDHCGRYAVYRSDGHHWHFFCYTYRERPY